MMEQKKFTAPRTKNAEDKKPLRAQRKVKTIKDTVTAVHFHNGKGCNSDHKLLFVAFKS
jgi:hypothetical protein